MLPFERELVARLTGTPNQERRAAIAAFVDATLHDMPEHIRAGIAAASVALGGWSKVRPGGVGVESLDGSRLGPLRQYVRLFRSLVLFAEEETQELSPA